MPEKEPPGLRTEATLAAIGIFAARALKRRAKDIAQRYAELKATTNPAVMNTAIERWAAQELSVLAADRTSLNRALAQRYDQFSTQLDNQLTRQIAKLTGEQSRLDPTALAAGAAAARIAAREQVDKAVKMTADQIDRRTRSLIEQVETTVAAVALYASPIWPTVKVTEAAKKQAAAQSRAAVDVAWSFQSAAANEKYRASGVEYATWVTQGDQRVRPKHRERQGKVYKISEGLGGIWPGSEVNCFVAETPVGVYGELKAITSRLWTGPLAGIQTAEGFRLRGTPNHPILTSRGWVALGELQRGDQVFRVMDPQSGGAHNEQGETPIGHRLETLRMENGLSRRTPGGHFHGDASDNEVEVVQPRAAPANSVGATSELMRHIVPGVGPQLSELKLTGTDGDFEIEGPERAAWSAIRAAGRIMRGLDLIGPGFGAHATPLDRLSLTLRSQDNAGVGQASGDDSSGDADLFAQLQDAVSAGVLIADTVKDTWREGDAVVRVHNLETSLSAYSASTIIVHNCRCYAVPKRPGYRP